jgi:hypothetical protein
MVSVGIMAITATMPGEIIGQLGIMVTIWIVAVTIGVMAVMEVKGFVPAKADMAFDPDKVVRGFVPGKVFAPVRAVKASVPVTVVKVFAAVRVVAAAM